MKKALIITTGLSLLFTISCKENSKNVNYSNDEQKTELQIKKIADISFSNTMTSRVFQDYQQLRRSLIASDSDGAKIAAQNLADGLSEDQKHMKLNALAMAEANELEKQRELFSDFSNKVESMFRESISAGSIYKQFCPMAFEGEGGYWISNVEEIKNPYYGNKMLKCGTAVEIIQ